MSKRRRVALVLALVSACRSTEPAPAALGLSGEGTVRVGGFVTLTPQTGDGAAASPYGFTWTVSDTTLASLRTTGAINTPGSRELIGRKAGVVTVTVTNAGGSATQQFTVVDDRPTVEGVLGQSVTGRLTNGVGEQRIAFTLAAGDTIDLSVTADSVEQYQIRLASADGSLSMDGAVRSGLTRRLRRHRRPPRRHVRHRSAVRPEVHQLGQLSGGRAVHGSFAAQRTDLQSHLETQRRPDTAGHGGPGHRLAAERRSRHAHRAGGQQRVVAAPRRRHASSCYRMAPCIGHTPSSSFE